MIDLLDVGLDDPRVQENFEKIRSYLNTRPLLSSDVKILEIKVANPSAAYEVLHGLGYKPKDILITHISNGTVNPIFASTTKKKISFNVTEACTFRVLIGSFDI